MHFAKVRTGEPYNLATSGVSDCVLSDLDPKLEDLALHGPNAYGYPPLLERIGARVGADPSCVVIAGGCSFANHLALAALIAPGDEVLIEDPTYALLESALAYLQANIRQVRREAARGWALDPDAVAERLSPTTRLVVLTNLHNPTSALADEAAVNAIAAAAHAVGAMVLIDEVYLELMVGSGPARTAFRADGNIIVTSSLTKAYGLSGLRCGWILAPAPLADRMRRLNDLYAVLPPHISERLSVLAFDRLDSLRARANAMIALNRAAYREYLGDHPGLDQVLFDHGTTVFPRLLADDADELLSRLRSQHQTVVAPGRFFGRENHIRIGLGGDPAMTRIGLERLAGAIKT